MGFFPFLQKCLIFVVFTAVPRRRPTLAGGKEMKGLRFVPLEGAEDVSAAPRPQTWGEISAQKLSWTEVARLAESSVWLQQFQMCVSVPPL